MGTYNLLSMASHFLYIKLSGNRYANMSDKELIDVYKKRKENAVIDEFFTRYAHLLYPICRRYLIENAKAKDTVMEIFSALGDKIVKHEIENFRSWLCIVARNECLMQIRKAEREIVIDTSELIQKFVVESGEEMHLSNEEESEEEKLSRLIPKLKNSQKLCLEMMYFQNMSYKEISQATGLSLKEVKSNIQNGKRKLRLMFEAKK